MPMKYVDVVPKEGELTPRQWNFCNEYMVDRQPNLASKRAGYKTPGMGTKLMRHTDVRKEIARREREAYELSTVSVAEIVGRLAEVMRFDVIDLCDENGQINLSDLSALPKEARACLKELDVKTYTDNEGNLQFTAKIKMYSKLEAMDMLMRYFGGYKPDVLQQLVQLDWSNIDRRAVIAEDDPLTKALAELPAPKDQ